MMASSRWYHWPRDAIGAGDGGVGGNIGLVIETAPCRQRCCVREA
jgi:hypothetical protein